MFCKCVISVATLLSIIHVTMYILISLIYQNSWHKTITALFCYTTIKCCIGRKAYSKYCIIVFLFSSSVLAEEWCRIWWDCFILYCCSPITPFLFVWYKTSYRNLLWQALICRKTVSAFRTLLLFMKVIQSFILMQNTY